METTDEEAVANNSSTCTDNQPIIDETIKEENVSPAKSNDESSETPQHNIEEQEVETETGNNDINTQNLEPEQPEGDKVPENDNANEQLSDKIKSRELKSLIAAVKESNLETNISHKRNSLTDQSGGRRNSTNSIDNSQASAKRNMRSQNPEFLAKHQKFISKVAAELDLSSAHEIDLSEAKKEKDANTVSLKRKRDDSNSVGSTVEEKKARKGSKVETLPLKPGKDRYCWVCHREGVSLYCVVCPRSFHNRCLKQNTKQDDEWMCPECVSVLRAENTATRSNAMKRLTQDKLGQVLRFALKRMKDTNGSEPFLSPVDTKVLPDYLFYVEQPMDLSQLQDNIRENMYGSTEAFFADAKWILHNSIIYNSSQSKLTSVAKKIVKKCKAEMYEVETCPECYINANTQKETWFIEACSQPHLLVWAKLKGYPYWPAKAVNISNLATVDVRFFGDHDKAWIPVKDVFLYSKKDPNTTNLQKNSIAESIKEVDLHIGKLIEKFGVFNHAPYRINLESENYLSQLQMMIPKYHPPSNQNSIMPVNLTKTVKKTYKNNKLIANKASPSPLSSNGNTIKKSLNTSKTTNNESANSPSKFPKNDSMQDSYVSEDDEEGNTSYYMGRTRKLLNPADSAADSDSDENKSDIKNVSPIQTDLDSTSSAKKTQQGFFTRGKVRTRGGYPNTSGRLKIMSGFDFEETKIKSNSDGECIDISDDNVTGKVDRRDSDGSTKSVKSDMSHISDKINRVEFSEMTEITIGNVIESNAEQNTSDSDDKPSLETIKMKPVIQVNAGDLLNTNLELRISPQKNTGGSIADKLMKKIAESERNVCQSENGEVQITKLEIVKKKVLQNETVEEKNTNQVENKFDQKESSTVLDNLNDVSDQNSVTKANTDDSNKLDDDGSKINITVESKMKDDTIEAVTTPNKIKSSSLAQLVSSVENSIKKRKIISTEITDKSDSSDSDGSDFHSLSEFSSESSGEDFEESDRNNQKNESSKITLVDVSKIILGENENSVKKNGPSQIPKDREECMIGNENNTVSSNNRRVNCNNAEKITREFGPKRDKQPDAKSRNESHNSNFPIPFNNVEIKEEYLDSDESGSESAKNKATIEEFFPALNLAPSVKISLVEKQKRTSVSSYESAKNIPEVSTNSIDINIDNVTKTIESVVKGDGKPRVEINRLENEIPKKSELKVISVAEINKKRSMSLGNKVTILPKQSARKSFIKPGNPIRSSEPLRKINAQKIPLGPKSDFNKSRMTQESFSKALESNKDKLVYISTQSSNMSRPVTLVPQSITMDSNIAVNNSIISMISQSSGTPKMSLFEIRPQGSNTVSKNVLGYQLSNQVSVRNVPINVSTPSSTTTTENQSEASIENNNIADGMPSLQKKPVGPLSAQHLNEPILSSAGPSSLILNQASQKLADYFRSIITETLSDVSKLGCNETKVKELQLEIESLKQKHKVEVNSLKSELATLREAYISEKQHALQELRNSCEQERIRSVEEAKNKQWCAACLKESQYRCCWNTSYCSYACQRAHWHVHQTRCQQGFESGSEIKNKSREQSDSSVNMSSSMGNVVSSNLTNNTISKPTIKHYGNKAKQPPGRVIKKNVAPKTPAVMSKQNPNIAASTLTFVETTAGMEVVGNTGPIALGGKLITASALPSKIKGFIVSNTNQTPAIVTHSNKSPPIVQQNIPKSISTTLTTVSSTTSTTPILDPISSMNQLSNPSINETSANQGDGGIPGADNNEIMEIDENI